MTDAHRCPEFTGLDMASGVNQEGEPFIHMIGTFVDGTSKTIAQFTPQELRDHALAALEVAEAAVHDAAFYAWMSQRADTTPGQAARLVHDLRKHRADQKDN